MSSISHRRAKELLLLAQDDTLLSTDATLLEHHLNRCEECGAFALSLSEDDKTLSDALQRRWRKPVIRQADTQRATRAVLAATAAKPWLQQAVDFTLSLGWNSLLGIILLGFVWAVANFTQPAANPDLTPESVSGGQDVEATTYLQTLARTDLNCDTAYETLFLERNLSPAHTAGASELMNPAHSLLIQDGAGGQYRFNASDLGGKEISETYIFNSRGCESLLGLQIKGGAVWFMVFRWTGETLEAVLQSPGVPMEIPFNEKGPFLNSGETLNMVETEMINTANCGGVNVEYEWTGIEFIKITDYRNGARCMGAP
jgi:hypothetical protein